MIEMRVYLGCTDDGLNGFIERIYDVRLAKERVLVAIVVFLHQFLLVPFEVI